MTNQKPPVDLEPVSPMPETLTAAALAVELDAIAYEMDRAGALAVAFGGWGAVAAYGHKMRRTAEHQRAWAARLRGRGA